MRLPRPQIAAKFFLPLAVSIPLIALLSGVAVHGLAALRDQANRLYDTNTRSLIVTTDLGRHLGFAEARGLALLVTTNARQRAALARSIEVDAAPAIARDLVELQGLHAHDTPAQSVEVRRLRAQLSGLNPLYAVVRRYGRGAAVAPSQAAAVSGRITRSLGPLTRTTSRLEAQALAEAGAAHAESAARYRDGRAWIMVFAALSLVGGVVASLLLTRSVVPRVRAYSKFASRVASGDMSKRVEPRGRDELTDLGYALNLMVDRRAEADADARAQDEFSETMQVAQTEQEAHELIKRHLERAVAGSSVVVLNRNNSEDRLDPMTVLPPGSSLAEPLETATPRSCLAVRFGRSHDEGGDAEPLVKCEVCGARPGRTTCQPLVVGGRVIGSVLVDHARPLEPAEADAIRDSVAQAAPVLANLGNLAVAEMRASTDALTGLPNNRAVNDAMRRMVAHASRTLTPLAAVLLDLDHFKAVNDTYGHESGDDVLAAVGAVLETCVRAGDFVGRQGGEEFTIFMPDTAAAGAVSAAEKIRKAIAAVSIAGLGSPVTASLGVAILPTHAVEAAELLRCADRALYTAKRNGRNRVELAPLPEAGDREAPHDQMGRRLEEILPAR